MSVEALSYVKVLFHDANSPRLTLSERHVLRAIALMHNTQVNCAYAPLAKIGEQALIGNERRVRTLVAALEAKGLLLRHPSRRDRDGSQTTNEYELPGMTSMAAVGLETRQQVFSVPRSRVGVQMALKVPSAAGGSKDRHQVQASKQKRGTTVGPAGRQQVSTAPVDFSLSDTKKSGGAPATCWPGPPATCWPPVEVREEKKCEEGDPPLPLPDAAAVENSEKGFLMKAKAQGQEQATARATAKACEGEPWDTMESRGGGSRVVRPGREALDGIDVALWDEATRVLVACGIAPDASTRRQRKAVMEALRLRVTQAACSVADAGGLAVARWREYCAASGQLRYTLLARRFFAEGVWLDPNKWPWERSRPDPKVGMQK